MVLLASALAYAAVGALALMLAGPPGYASPLYPPAGIALAAALVYGRGTLPGVLLGSFTLNLGLASLRGPTGLADLLLPFFIGSGAALQAGAGAALVQRFVARPLVLNEPRDILRFGLLGAALPCLISASVATAALVTHGTVAREAALANWSTWWLGDTLGALIGAPLALIFIGRPRADWRSRLRTVGLPLLLALGLLVAAMVEFDRLDERRVAAAFESDTDRVGGALQQRLQAPLYALRALHDAARVNGTLDALTLRNATRWWIEQPLQLQAMGYSERVALDALPAFEATARDEGAAAFRVFDRDDGRARAADGEVVALRRIEPAAGNAAALGVNTLSIPAARAAVLAARDSGQPVASAPFRLTQSAGGDELGLVIYQALYRGDAADAPARRQQFQGVVFVTLRVDRALAAAQAAAATHVHWCVTDAQPPQQRLAGSAGCEDRAAPEGALRAGRDVAVAGRTLQLAVWAQPAAAVPGREREAAWLLALAGMAAVAMLGALLLTVTGQRRVTQLAVQRRTAELQREVAERAQAEAALRDSEARLRGILDHAPLGVMFLEPSGVLIDGNPRLAQMLGLEDGALLGRQVADFIHPDDHEGMRAHRRRLMAGEPDVVMDDARLLGRDGELRARVAVAALRDAHGRVLRMVGVVQDITERLQLEASERALHRAEASNRAKSEFVSRMSHELRTPLNAMIGFAQLLGLDREPRLAPHQGEWAQQIQRAGWHLLDMINETLDLARIESGAVKLEPVSVALAPLVAACRAMVAAPAAQRGIGFTEVVPEGTAVSGDATRLKQVLTNLLSNAVKYNRDGGGVTVRVRHDGAVVELTVADTGLGMTPEQLAALFQPYNRLGRENSGIEGTGIGLVISRRLAELMGGTLDAASHVGRGSTFTLRLPAAALAADTQAGPVELPLVPYQQRRVHYVEDNAVNVEVMRGIIAQRAQIRLDVSSLGLDGLSAIRTSRPDLVLLDMQLPDISGLELLRHLKQDDAVAAIPVIVVSADATPSHMQQALTLGAAHYVTKPLDVADFLRRLDTLLESAETRWGM